MEDKKYKETFAVRGNAREVSDKYINITINIDDLLELAGKEKFVKFNLKRRFRPDHYGNTHVIIYGHQFIKKSDDKQPFNADNKGKSTLEI